MFHSPGVQVVARVPSAGPVPPPIMRGDAAVERLPGLLRTDEMDVRVDAAGGEDAMLAGNDLGGRPDLQTRRHAVLDVRVAGLADGDDAAVANADVRFDDAPVVDDDGVGDHEVGRAARRASTCDCPWPSRITLPPPKTTSSP